MNASLETATLQFKILMGDAGLAEEHVASLFEFAKRTPFETGPIIQASRMLEVMGGAALNTEETLRMVGDAAAGASAPIQEVANWVGRAYSAIQAGRPFGEAAQRLQELGLLSGVARSEIEALAESGASSEVIWASLQSQLGRFAGSMEELQGTWAGLTSTFSDSLNILVSTAFKPFFEEAKVALEGVNEFLDSEDAVQWASDMQEAVRTVIRALGGFPDSADPVSDFLELLPELITATADPLQQFVADLGAINREIQELRGTKETWGEFFSQVGSFSRGVAGAARPMGIGMGVISIRPPAAAGGEELPPSPEEAAMAERYVEALHRGEASYRDFMESKRIAEREAAAARRQATAEEAAATAAATAAAREAEKVAKEHKKALAEAAAEARKIEAAIREAEQAHKEWLRTMPMTTANFAAAFSAESMGSDLGVGRGPFETMRRALEEGGEQNITAVARMAADTRERFRRTALTPEDADDWIGRFLDAVNVTIVTGSVDAARNVGELIKAFDTERQIGEAMRKYEDAVNVGLEDTERSIVEAQGKTAEAMTKLLNDAFTADAVKARMDELQQAVRDGMKRAADLFEEGTRDLAALREGRDLATTEGRNAIVRDERRARDRAQVEENYQKRVAEIRRRGGTGMGGALADAGQQYMEQKRALEERIRLEDADRTRQQQWAVQDRMIRDADRAMDRERQQAFAASQEALRTRLEIPIKELNLAIEQRRLAERIAEIRRGEVETVARLNAQLQITLERLERIRDVDIIRSGGQVPSGGESGSGTSTGIRDINQTNNFNGPVGPDEIKESMAVGLQEAAQRLRYSA